MPPKKLTPSFLAYLNEIFNVCLIHTYLLQQIIEHVTPLLILKDHDLWEREQSYFHTWHHPLALGYSQQHLKYDAWRDSGKIKRAKVEILKWWRTNRPLKFFISLDSHIPIHMSAFIFENIGSIFTRHCKYWTFPKVNFWTKFRIWSMVSKIHENWRTVERWQEPPFGFTPFYNIIIIVIIITIL